MCRWYVLLTIWLCKCILHCNIFIVCMFMTSSTSYCLVTLKDLWNVYMYVCIVSLKMGRKKHTLYEDFVVCWRLVERDSPKSLSEREMTQRKLQGAWRSTDSGEAFFTSKCRATRVNVISLMPFKKPTVTQHIFIDISCTKFHSCRMKNVENTGNFMDFLN